MSISATKTKEYLERRLLAFAWNEWSQMGVLATPDQPSPWAQDPEALLLFTLDVARADPRLFDEVLDWLLFNEGHISVRRVRALSRRVGDATLAAAALEWASGRGRDTSAGSSTNPSTDEPQRLFFDKSFPIRHPDAVFLRHGWLRPKAKESLKAKPPELRAPVNFAFRLRLMLGTGARAEVVRYLLCADAPSSTVATITQSAMYTKRNVHEALSELEDAEVAMLVRGGWETRHGIDHERWAVLLDQPDGFPSHVHWPQLLAALARILRWLRDAERSKLSDYLLASAATDLLAEVRNDLELAGVAMLPQRGSADALADLDGVIERSLDMISVSK
jgi:hypothetical protein